ncbi:MAG: hypothetical protein QMD77_00095 [Patescibacteria group bacterium]|nr:hypothetical protein [Patescibacteria group bacterium]
MAKFKMVEPNDNPEEGTVGWKETELGADTLIEALKEALATKDIFVAEVE